MRQTLIGTPQQTEMGVTFKVLLDSSLTIGKLVKLDQSAIKLIPVFPGQIPAVLSQNGLYIVAGLRHYGDSRGDPWYSEVIAVNRLWSDVFRAGQFPAAQ